MHDLRGRAKRSVVGRYRMAATPPARPTRRRSGEQAELGREPARLGEVVAVGWPEPAGERRLQPRRPAGGVLLGGGRAHRPGPLFDRRVRFVEHEHRIPGAGAGMGVQPGAAVTEQREHRQRAQRGSAKRRAERRPGPFGAVLEREDQAAAWSQHPAHLGEAAGQPVAVAVAAGPDPHVASLAAAGRGPADADRYRDGLTRCFAEMGRVLRPGGRLVFTFQHRTERAWAALGTALRGTPLRPLAVFPLLGDGGTGLHAHPGASTWDAVFVLDKPDPPVKQRAGPVGSTAAEEHAARWAARLEATLPGRFRPPDRDNFTKACRLAAELGLFA